MTTTAPTLLEDALEYWFGERGVVCAESPNQVLKKWRASLWFYGIDPSVAKSKKSPGDSDNTNENGQDSEAATTAKSKRKKFSDKELEALTDKHILERFGGLFDTVEEEEVLTLPLDQKLSAIILWTQLSRHAFRNTSKAFMYDVKAQNVAGSILKDIDLSSLSFAGGAAPVMDCRHYLFVCIALMVSEDPTVIENGLQYFERLRLLYGTFEGNSELMKRLRAIERIYVDNLVTIQKFGRYPDRNKALGRESTTEEEHFIMQQLPTWQKKQIRRQKVITSNVDGSVDSVTKAGKPKKILVLHGSPATVLKFKQQVKNKLNKLGSEDAPVHFEFLRGPHQFQGHKSGTGEPNNWKEDPHLRCWWHTMENADSMEYAGIDLAIETIENWFQKHGPYDGILGFSQGATLAAIVAALMDAGKLNHVQFQFLICISGFYSRDNVQTKYLNIHTDVANEHLPGSVKARQAKIRVPSFHTWGEKDQQIEGWRSQILSQAFLSPTTKPHTGGHLTPGYWPVEDMQSWLLQLDLDQEGGSYSEASNSTEPFPSFPEKFFAARRGALTKKKLPVGIHYQKEIYEDPFWDEIDGKVDSDEDSAEAAVGFVNRILKTTDTKQHGLQNLQDDLMAAAWSFYRFGDRNRKAMANEGRPFFWIVRALVDFAYEDSDNTRQKYMLDFHLEWISRYADSWETLNRILLLFESGSTTRTGAGSVLGRSQFAEPVHQRIASLYGNQLSKDFAALQASGINNGIEPPDVKISRCAEHAPKRGSALHRTTGIVSSIAKSLWESTPNRQELFKDIRGSPESCYMQVLQALNRALRGRAAGLQATQSTKEAIKLEVFGYLNETYWKNMHNNPISVHVRNPKPEPVDVSTREQLEPLFRFLQQGLVTLPQPEITFERGTLIDDGRLDLCKQVIGPKGVAPFFDSLKFDSGGLVEHILLGNNIAGDDLGRAVADYVKSGQSKVLTWYIAGNNMTEKGIAQVCEALKEDKHVRQLWLKRNPLLSPGAVPLAGLLSTNTHLQVLDVTNTGLLDEGVRTLLQGLRSNSTLQHLYLDTNGITHDGVCAIRDYFENTKSTALVGLSLGCNRIFCKGVEELIKGLRSYRHLKRLTLASCGIGPEGASKLAEFLAGDHEGSRLHHLDLGILKSTVSVGEIPNRISNEGAIALAGALAKNTTLESLDVSNNAIYAEGIEALERALSSNPSSVLRRFGYKQYGTSIDTLVQEKIHAQILKHQNAWEQRCAAAIADSNEEIVDYVDPKHLDEIQSVYRVGNSYD